MSIGGKPLSQERFQSPQEGGAQMEKEKSVHIEKRKKKSEHKAFYH